MPEGLSRSSAPQRADTSLPSVPEVYDAFKRREQLLLSLGREFRCGVAGREPVPAAAEPSCDLSDVHTLGAQRYLRAADHLSQVTHDFDAGHRSEAVYRLLRVEFGSAGTLIVGAVHRGDQSLPVALGVGHRNPDDIQLLQGTSAVYPIVDLS